jgi:hypothetical protein
MTVLPFLPDGCVYMLLKLLRKLIMLITVAVGVGGKILVRLYSPITKFVEAMMVDINSFGERLQSFISLSLRDIGLGHMLLKHLGNCLQVTIEATADPLRHPLSLRHGFLANVHELVLEPS